MIEGIDVLQGAVRRADGEGPGRVPADHRQGKKGDKAVEAVLEHFRDKEKREEFYGFFRELEELYEILSPDAFLRPYLTDYDELLRMYHLLRAQLRPGHAGRQGVPAQDRQAGAGAHTDRRHRGPDEVPRSERARHWKPSPRQSSPTR